MGSTLSRTFTYASPKDEFNEEKQLSGSSMLFPKVDFIRSEKRKEKNVFLQHEGGVLQGKLFSER
jgi:hypothetical protein